MDDVQENLIRQAVNLLGKECEDKVTGFRGTISSVHFDLYGCVQAIVTSKVDKKSDVWGSSVRNENFDIHRLKIKLDTQVMPVPSFDEYTLMLCGRQSQPATKKRTKKAAVAPRRREFQHGPTDKSCVLRREGGR